MDRDNFIQEVISAYTDAHNMGMDSIVLAIDTDTDRTYYINENSMGFQRDLWSYQFDDLDDISGRLYNELQGNVTEIRIE